MWKVLLAVLGLAACARVVTYANLPPPDRMYILEQVVQQWGLMYREFSTEFMGCLYGRMEGGQMALRVFIPAAVRPSNSTDSTVTGECYEEKKFPAMGVLHSHVARVDRPSCYVSKRDSVDFADSPYAVTLIVCGADRVLVMFRDWQPIVVRYDSETGKIKHWSSAQEYCMPHSREEFLSCGEE